MNHSDIKTMERFGTLTMSIEVEFKGICECCEDLIYENDGLAYYTDNQGNLFCCKDCAIDYHGIKEVE